MNPTPAFSQQEINSVQEGYRQYLEGKIISNRKAKTLSKKWFLEKSKP